MKEDYNEEDLPILIVNEQNSPPPKIIDYMNNNDNNETKEKATIKSANNKSNGKKPQKKRSKKNIFLTVTILINIGILITMSLNIYKWYSDNEQIKRELKDINDLIAKTKIKEPSLPTTTEVEKVILVNDEYLSLRDESINNLDFNKLIEKNNDTKGWIKVNGTEINYPFVQTTNNEFYLTHSFSKNKNSAGWVFLDYRNNIENLSKNTIIYGHGRLNNTMFGSLKKIVKKEWLSNKDNFYVQISTPKGYSLWQVFSTYTIMPESYYIKTKFNDSEYLKFLNTLKSRSVHDFNVSLTENDYILTLSSCYDNSKRVVLHAKLIEKNNL